MYVIVWNDKMHMTIINMQLYAMYTDSETVQA